MLGLIARQRQVRRGNHSTGHRVQLELGDKAANSTFHWKEKEKKVSDEMRSLIAEEEYSNTKTSHAAFVVVGLCYYPLVWLLPNAIM